MFKKIQLFILILIFSASSKTFGFAEFQQNLKAHYPIVISVQSTNLNLTKGNIAPDTGIVEPISATFIVSANDFLYAYDLVLNATTMTQSGAKNAYYYDGNTMYLILTNTSYVPLVNSINDIKSGLANIDNNPNTIAYPITSQGYRIHLAELKNDSTYDGYYYNLSSLWFRAGVRQTISNAPLQNTYSLKNDNPGIYEATLTLSAIPKP